MALGDVASADKWPISILRKVHTSLANAPAECHGMSQVSAARVVRRICVACTHTLPMLCVITLLLSGPGLERLIMTHGQQNYTSVSASLLSRDGNELSKLVGSSRTCTGSIVTMRFIRISKAWPSVDDHVSDIVSSASAMFAMYTPSTKDQRVRPTTTITIHV